MRKFFTLVLATVAATTLASAAVQQTSASVDCGTSKTIVATPATGYHFVRWEKDGVAIQGDATLTVQNIQADATYEAIFAANTNTQYTVKHWLQDILNDNYIGYPTTPDDTDILEGTTGTATAAEAKTTYTGFTPQTITQGTIAGDGSTVVNVFYTRNSYTLAWVTDGNALSGNYTQGSVKYGATITAPNTPTKTGYTFKAWSPAVSSTMPAENTTYTATWNPATNTAYTVEHYQETLAGTYPTTATESESKTGTTGQNTAAEAKTNYTGFTAQSFSQATIAADGTTVVKIYYTRNSYTLAWVTDGNALSGNYTQGSVKYGATITAPNTPTKTGYTFKAWSPAVSSTMPAENTTYTATWDPATNTAYTVEHYQETLAGTYPTTATESESKTGTTGQNTAAEAKAYTGFTAQSFSQATIAADGSTVVKIYYKRDLFTVIFKNYDGTELQTLTDVKYGATPVYTGNTPVKPSDADYNYVWENVWNPALGAITGNTTYTATFTQVAKDEFAISVVVDPVGKGTVTGAGNYKEGASATLTAESDDACYVFEKWMLGDQEVGTNATLTITNINANATYTAVFRVLQHTITIKSSDDTKGTVSFQ